MRIHNNLSLVTIIVVLLAIRIGRAQEDVDVTSTSEQNDILEGSNSTERNTTNVDDFLDSMIDNDLEEEIIPNQANTEDQLHADDMDEVIDLDKENEINNTTKSGTITLDLTKKSVVEVKDYLDTLADSELEKICVERGFDVTAPTANTDDTTRHNHYVEAARRCLRLDDEINAVIAKNPDLAAELEAEIERMRLEKERLTKEREEILAEKALLEERLKEAGVHISTNGTISVDPKVPKTTSPSLGEPQSLEEVLKESFALLWQRVYQDIKLVSGIVQQVTAPIIKSTLIVWRYSQPTVDAVARKVLINLVRVGKMEVVQGLISSIAPLFRVAWTNTLLPVVEAVIEKSSTLSESILQTETVDSIISPLKPGLQQFWASATAKFESIKSAANTWIAETLEDE